MTDGLSSIEGLADKHQRVLTRHHVTDLRGLVQADRRVIHRAMANLRPRPTLELISRWQDEARSMLDEVVTDTADWHTAASFVVIFSQLQREGIWEHRIEVERTEVEPERNPQIWSGWACAPVCAWMTSQLGQPGTLGPPPPAGRPQLRIDSAALIDAAGRMDVVMAGGPAADSRTELAAPVRVVLTVSGPGQERTCER